MNMLDRMKNYNRRKFHDFIEEDKALTIKIWSVINVIEPSASMHVTPVFLQHIGGESWTRWKSLVIINDVTNIIYKTNYLKNLQTLSVGIDFPFVNAQIKRELELTHNEIRKLLNEKYNKELLIAELE